MPRPKVTRKLEQNITLLKQGLHHTDGIVTRKFTITFQDHLEIDAALLYLDGMASSDRIHRELLRPLLVEARNLDEPIASDVITHLKQSLLPTSELSEVDDFSQILLAITSGEVILFIDGCAQSLTFDTKGWEHRGIEPSQTEAVIRGPRDSFTEALNVNLMLIRRRIRDPKLIFQRHNISEHGRNDIVIAYIQGLVKPELLTEVETRLKKVKLDIILDSGYIEQLIEDSWWSPFNTIQDTERPDEVAAGLTEGRIAILVDNSPFALLAPATFNTQMLSPEDYYLRWPVVNFVRLLRFIASFAALVTPSLYIAVVSFHPEMIPTQLALSIAATRDGIPFPVFVEAIIMELALELLREAGIRLPGPIGQTVGIVGGLIIGDAAVRANLVSPIMVIVVALTAIAGFIIPTYTLGFGLRITRFFLMLLASVLGLYGLTLGMLVVLGHLANLTSFGVSYLSPWAPLNIGDLADSIIRMPWQNLNKQPNYTKPDRTSQDSMSKRRRKAKKK